MKILVICHEHPPVGGGAGMAASNIARKLVDFGHTVHFVTTLYGGQKRSEQLNGYDICRIDIGRKYNYRSSVWEWMKFMIFGTMFTRSLILRNRPDYIFAFFTLPAGFIAVTLKIMLNVPVLVSIRGQDLPGFCPEEYRLHHIFASPLFKYIWKKSNVVVVQSKRQLKKLVDYKISNLNYSPNGVDSNFFKPHYKKEHSDSVTILYSGRLTLQKNICWFILIFNRLKNKINRKVKFIIVGDGFEKKKLIKLVKELSLDSSVCFYPWCNRDEMLLWYQQSDIYVLPSLDEGMPNSITEAMACGLAVVATRVSGTEELINHGDDGFLAEIDDAVAFENYLTILISDDAKREIICQNARLRSLNRSWGDVANKYISSIV